MAIKLVAYKPTPYGEYRKFVCSSDDDLLSLPNSTSATNRCDACSEAYFESSGVTYELTLGDVWQPQAKLTGKFDINSTQISDSTVIEIQSKFAKNTAAGTAQALVQIPKPTNPVLLYKASMYNPSIDSDLTVKLFNRRIFNETGTVRAITTGTAQVLTGIARSVSGTAQAVSATPQVITGTATAGDATHITLASGSVITDDYYNGRQIKITSGTGSGQSAIITDYVGSTLVATVAEWTVIPDATSVYRITEDATHIKLAAGSSASDDYYNGKIIKIISGLGVGQQRTVVDYVGASLRLEVSAWDIMPDETSTYLIVENAIHMMLQIGSSASNDYYNNKIITIYEGTGLGQTRSIIDYVAATLTIEVAAWEILPDNTSKYKITESATNIMLQAGSSATNDFYNNKVITIYEGLGEGQTRTITDYVGATTTAVVAAWDILPDSTSKYVIQESTTQVMLASAASASDDAYNAALIRIKSGTGVGQVRTISDYTGATKTATISEAWETLPDATSVYAITVNGTHIDLNVDANPTNDFYNGFNITITSGTGAGQTRAITDYVGGTTNTAEVAVWDSPPDDTSEYSIAIIRDALVFDGIFDKANLTAPVIPANDSDVIKGLFTGGCDVYYQVSNNSAIANADGSRFTAIFILEAVC